MPRSPWLVAALAAVALVACTDDGPVSDPTSLTLTTGEFSVPVGDTFMCFYTDVFSDGELSVGGATGRQGPGGHHILAYYAETARPVGSHPCTDEEMVNLHQIAGSSGDGGAVLDFRDNLAIKIPTGKQFVLQAHYINVTDGAYLVDDEVALQFKQPDQVRAYVNYFVTNDEGFEIPAGAAYSHTSYCTTRRDLDIVLSLGHMHEEGKHYKLEMLDATGTTTTRMLHDDAWQPSFASHPPVKYYPADQPLHLPAGTRLRQTCDWDNTTSSVVLFPREMCLSFMYYFPGDGEDITCNNTAQ